MRTEVADIKLPRSTFHASQVLILPWVTVLHSDEILGVYLLEIHALTCAL